MAPPVATTATLDITPVNDAPVIDLVNLAGVQTAATTASFTEGGGAVAVLPQVTLSDVDSATRAGATVTLTDAQVGDVLSLQGQAGTSGVLASVAVASKSASCGRSKRSARRLSFTSALPVSDVISSSGENRVPA